MSKSSSDDLNDVYQPKIVKPCKSPNISNVPNTAPKNPAPQYNIPPGIILQSPKIQQNFGDVEK